MKIMTPTTIMNGIKVLKVMTVGLTEFELTIFKGEGVGLGVGLGVGEGVGEGVGAGDGEGVG